MKITLQDFCNEDSLESAKSFAEEFIKADVRLVKYSEYTTRKGEDLYSAVFEVKE